MDAELLRYFVQRGAIFTEGSTGTRTNTAIKDHFVSY